MVVVMGMARSGLAVSRLLREEGFDVLASDVLTDPPLAGEFERDGIPSETGGHSAGALGRAAEIVVSPGVPLGIAPLEDARRRGTPVISELEVASRYLQGDVVAITGSNGKTTTTALTGRILSVGERPVQVGGNIGTPASSMVAASRAETINVLEVSSFQLDGIRTFRPDVGVLLNITPDHMDRYATFEAYRQSKLRMFANQTGEDHAVVNRDDGNVFPLPAAVRSRRASFSRCQVLEVGAWVADGQLVLDGTSVMPLSRVPLRGAHNVENVLAALVVGGVYGITEPAAAAAVASFRPVEHRLETVATVDGVEFVNDSKATNVDSAVKALESFSGPVIVILGGQDKGGSPAALVRAMKGRVRRAVLIGAAAEMLEAAIGGAVPSRRAASMAEALDLALEPARPGDVVLLAPACASFDMYDDYAARGDDFKNAVRSYAESRA